MNDNSLIGEQLPGIAVVIANDLADKHGTDAPFPMPFASRLYFPVSIHGLSDNAFSID